MGNKKLSPEEKAYIAGIVDGEGCISLYKNRATYIPRLTIVNTNPLLSEYLQTKLGGNTYKSKKKEGWKVAYNWQVQNQLALDIVKTLLPYLILKRELALLFLSLQAIRDTGKNGKKFKGRFTSEAKEGLEMVFVRIHKFNSRGTLQQ